MSVGPRCGDAVENVRCHDDTWNWAGFSLRRRLVSGHTEQQQSPHVPQLKKPSIYWPSWQCPKQAQGGVTLN